MGPATGQSEKRRSRRVRAGFWAALALAPFLAMPLPVKAIDLAACDKDNLPQAVLDECSRAIYAEGTTAEDRIRIYTLRGVAWMREEEPAAAIADFTRAIDLDASNIAALRGRAHAQTAMGRHDGAARDWTSIIAVQPDTADNYRERGLAYLASGHSAQALSDFDKAIALDPQNPDHYIGKARVYGLMKQPDHALKEFDRAIVVRPDYAQIYMARGAAAESWGDTRIAVESYRKALKYPNDVSWYAIRALQRLGVDWTK